MPNGLIGTVVDGTGTVIISNGLRHRDVGQSSPPTSRSRPSLMPTGFRPGVAAGRRATVSAVARSAVSPWLVVVELPKAALEEPRRSAWLLIGASALVFLLCGLLLAPVASRGIVSLFEALRKAADKATREKDDVEALYRTYFDSTTESLFIVEVTPDGRFVFEALNPVHERLTGLRPHHHGKEPHECLVPETAVWVTANYRRCVEAGVPIRYDEVLGPAGRHARLGDGPCPVRDPATGRICRIVGSARDITERRAMFEALRDSEERFRAMADTVPDILYVSDPHGRCIYVNARYYEFTGLHFGAVAGTGWLRCHPSEGRARRDGVDARAVRATRCSSANSACGPPMAAIAGSSAGRGPSSDAAGRVVRWFGTATDVDELKQAQAALQSTNRRLRTILSSISDAYYAVDRDWRFVDVNEQAASWVGLHACRDDRAADHEIFPNTSVIDYIRRVMGGNVADPRRDAVDLQVRPVDRPACLSVARRRQRLLPRHHAAQTGRADGAWQPGPAAVDDGLVVRAYRHYRFAAG